MNSVVRSWNNLQYPLPEREKERERERKREREKKHKTNNNKQGIRAGAATQ